MCGRTRCTLRADDIPRACHLNGRPVRHVNMDRYLPSYNVSPGFNVPVIRRDDGATDEQGEGQGQAVALHCMKWGLIPSFTKKTEKPDHYKMFNARSESVREKASFRRLVPQNRCLVAVEGFYEWKKDGSKKQPYYIHFKDERPLVFAALFDSWKNPEGDVIYTFTILTTSSSSTLKWLHDRMPVILGNKEAIDLWLNGSPSSNFDTILKPYEETDLTWYPVTPAMGKPSFDDPECIREIQLKTDETKTISQFFSKKGVDNRGTTVSKSTVVHEEPTRDSQLKNLKIEPGIQQDSKNEEGAKLNGSTLPYNDRKDTKIKQDYEELSADLKLPAVESGKMDTSPKRKKAKTAETNVSALPRDDEKDIRVKRDYEELSADIKLPVVESGKLCKSPMRKKVKGAGDKQQQTLFSYFGKS